MIKMIVTDLDGTLLRNDKTLSEYTAAVLARCSEEGIKVVFATARPLRTIKPYLECVHCDALIYHNGAHIIADGKRIGEPQTIPIETARRILFSLQSIYPGERLSAEINDVLYANFDVAAIWNYTSAVMTGFSDLPDIDADKIIIEATSNVKYEKIVSLLTPDIYCQMSENAIYLIMNRNATKFNGIKTLSRHWGIELKQVAAFGDDNNDMEMIINCGAGVAVGNAIQDVLGCADFIADTNNNDGVARFIEDNLTEAEK
jgi:5-amino-6-(5-phospho-D-ribitylamino)uracil phosphatase